MEEKENNIEQIKIHIKEAEKKMEKKPVKKQPNCARCHKPKKTRRHHWPIGSLRLVPLCSHCYKIARDERKRRAKYFGGRL